MVTKCDLVAGFAEYFDDLTQEGRAQVWGVTFPYEQTRARRRAPTRLPPEFDALMARLNERVFARLEEERDARRRATHLRLSAADGGAARSADAVRERRLRLDASSTSRSCCAASTSPAARRTARRSIGCSARIGRRFGVAPDAVAPPPGRGKAYFVERLLKQVVIGESGLAGVNRRLELQKAAGSSAPTRRSRLRGRGRRRRLVGQLRRQPRLSRRRSADDLTTLASRRRRRCRAPSLEVAAAAARRGARRRRLGQPLSRRRRRGDALGAVPGRLGRQRRARRLPARARQHRAAAVRRARQAAADRVRVGAGEAVRLSQGLPDARRSRSIWTRSICSTSRISSGSMPDAAPGAGRRCRSTSRACSTTATRCVRLPLDAALVAQARSTHSPGVDPADHVRAAAARCYGDERAGRCSST